MKLKEITTVVTDYVANGSFKSLRDNAYYVSPEKGYARVIRLTDYNNSFDLKDTVWVDKHGYDFLSKSSLQYNDIIVSNVGAYLGTVFLAPKLQYPITLGPNAILIRPNNKVLNLYLYYSLLSNAGFSKIMAIKSGSAMPKFNKTDLKEIDFDIHDIDEQQHIVDILGTLDEKIEKLDNITLKIQEYGNKLFSLIPLNKLEKLTDVVTFTKGKEIGSFNYLDKQIDGSVPYIRVGDLIGRNVATFTTIKDVP